MLSVALLNKLTSISFPEQGNIYSGYYPKHGRIKREEWGKRKNWKKIKKREEKRREKRRKQENKIEKEGKYNYFV